MKLIVGLGNPGAKYALTRHNIGFMVVDALAQECGVGQFRDEHKAKTAKTALRGQQVLLAKPQTFMNLSGDSVRPLLDFYKVGLPDMLVIQDDVDMPFGSIRFHIRRGHGGHNGIRHLHQLLASEDYARLKLGVGRPLDPRHDMADFVTGKFTEPENDLIDFLGASCEAVEFWLESGTEKAANFYNGMKKG
jgi:peptidyl-tRNA hydrolase, PTH1 family